MVRFGSITELNRSIKFDYRTVRLVTPGTCAPDDIQGLYSIVDGVSFMKAMINFLEQRRILNYNGPTFGGEYAARDGKRLYVKFRWEGEDMIMDNTRVYIALVKSPSFSIHQDGMVEEEHRWNIRSGSQSTTRICE